MKCGLLEAILAAEALAQREYEAATLAGLLDSLGRVSPGRVRCAPAPGTATVADVVRLRETEGRAYELVDGTLVEKASGRERTIVARALQTALEHWSGNGVVVANSPLELIGGSIRVPDLSASHSTGTPDLAVEVLSEGNTREEMERKLKEYFLSEVQLVWYIDPRKRVVQVYTSPDDVTELSEADTLDGGAVLPDFAVEVAQLFDQLAPPAKPAKPPKGGKKPKKK